MAKVLKRVLIVLVPSVIGLIFTWLGRDLAYRGRLSPEAHWIVAYGAPVLLIVLTGWMSARHGGLGRWPAAFAGALVFLLGRVLPLTAAALLVAPRSELRWRYIEGIIVVAVVLLPVVLSLGYFGAWIASLERPKARSA